MSLFYHSIYLHKAFAFSGFETELLMYFCSFFASKTLGIQIPRLLTYLVSLHCFPHWITGEGYLRSVFHSGKSPGDWVHWGADIVCTVNGVMSYCCWFVYSIIGWVQIIMLTSVIYTVQGNVKIESRQTGGLKEKQRETRKYHISSVI